MGTFKFRLQTLLHLREAARDQRRHALAEAQEALDLLQNQFATWKGEADSLSKYRQQAQAAGALQVDALIASDRHELLLNAQHQVLAQQRQQLEEEIERRREALAEADREVRVLEKLRDKQEERHRQAMAAREQRAMDELALRPFQRGDA